MLALVAYLSVESEKTVPTTSRIPPARRAFVAGARLRSCLVRQLSWTDSVWSSRHQFMVTPTQMAYDSELSNRGFFCTISDRLLLPGVSHLIISSSSSAASPSSSNVHSHCVHGSSGLFHFCVITSGCKDLSSAAFSLTSSPPSLSPSPFSTFSSLPPHHCPHINLLSRAHMHT